MAEYALGIVVNPKLKEPVLAIGTSSLVYMHSLQSNRHGWLENVGEGSYGLANEWSAYTTGYPRAHLGAGVPQKRKGYGTALYTGLCLGAYASVAGMADLKTGKKGAGISSMAGATRTPEADAWWKAARDRGLADVVVGDDGTYEVYVYDSAKAHNLIVAVFSNETLTSPTNKELGALWRRLRERGPSELTSLELILGLDVRGMSEDALGLVGSCANAAGASEAELDGMVARWQYGMDPSAPLPEFRRPFKKNSAEALVVQEALERTQEARDQLGWEALADLP